MNAYLFQSSGDLGRLDTMRQLLREKGVSVVLSLSDLPSFLSAKIPESPDTLVFFHSTDSRSKIDAKLESATNGGAVVVNYSGGRSRDEETERPTGKGVFLYLSWNTVPELLRRLPNGFKREHITATWREMRRCDLVNALAILCQAVTAETRLRSSENVQKEWKSNREKWRKVFPGYDRDDFLNLCDGLLSDESAKNIPEVRKIIDWMTAEGNDAPGPLFEKALEQMQDKFRLVV